ncbi:ATP-binding protein [Pelagicoccus sp. SDUM812005]|uniref:sensor histidine kinase n=1 Tax=Pelagicoccus sp. SDUM812005 TaxID=3041257 RepID=UPI00281012F8|nr:ATP-binding protein [Pelagicoccus sp. SDUM812005]MDQ8182139.1 ATP-binding protein [Pelagicoccus sp. SDUM812005]
MKIPFQSIRWRIQAWHGLILLMAIAAFCGTAYQLAWLNQRGRIDRELQKQERALIREITDRSGGLPSEAGTVQNKRIPYPQELYQKLLSGGIEGKDTGGEESGEESTDTLYYAFADADGRVLLKSANAPERIEFPSFSEGGGMLEEMRMNGTNRESVHSFDFGLRSVVGLDISADLAEKRRFAWSLAGSGVALWLGGLLGGWWLAGKAIRPIQSISRTASRIAEGNLNERISLSGKDSELDQLSRVLNHTFDRLNATLEQQRQFTADASHELRTPLTILLSESHRMRKREIPRSSEDYQESFELCHEAAERMRNLVESLLLLARQDSNPPGTEGIDCDLATVLAESISLIKPLAESKGIRLKSELPSMLIRANPELLSVVFNNLIGNAVQHHGGKGRVQVKVEANERAAVVRVIDDGPGISPEDLPRIFDRFYRVDRSRSDSQAGHSGLGLALAKAIVENVGGRIEVASVVGKGSEFRVVLPDG